MQLNAHARAAMMAGLATVSGGAMEEGGRRPKVLWWV